MSKWKRQIDGTYYRPGYLIKRERVDTGIRGRRRTVWALYVLADEGRLYACYRTLEEAKAHARLVESCRPVPIDLNVPIKHKGERGS